jgi:putative MATE family efflux protein
MTRIENDLTKGNVFSKLTMFALPFFASNLIQSFYAVTDVLIIGRFCGTESVSAVVIGGQVLHVLTSTVAGFCLGGTVLVGQYMGAGNNAAFKKIVVTLITFLLIMAFIVSFLLLIFRNALLTIIHTPVEAFSEGVNYLTVSFLGIIFIFIFNALSAILQGMGNTKLPFYFVLISCALNVVLDIVFEAGFHMKALGAAMATIISQAFCVYLCIHYMVKNNFMFDFKLHSLKIDHEQLKLLIQIGLPTCIQNTIISLSFVFISAIVNFIGGVTASAGVGIVDKFRRFISLPVIAIGASISAMTAQNFGAGHTGRAVKAFKFGLFISICICIPAFLFIQLFPVPILKIFGEDPKMIQDGVTYIRSYSFDLLLFPFVYCISSFLIGGGHTVIALINSLLSTLILRVPACYFFGIVKDLGIIGVGLSAPFASASVLIIMLIVVFKVKEKWKSNVIHPEVVSDNLN